MDLWIPVSIFAAFCQNLRSALQKHLKDRLSTTGAAMARFCYAVPFAFAYAAVLSLFGGFATPQPNPTFIFYMLVGGTAQILGTVLLVYVFSLRHFAVGNTFSKTETVQAAVFGWVILGDRLTGGAVFGIVVSLFGVVLLSVAKTGISVRNVIFGWTERSAIIGIVSGSFFGGSGVAYRAASLSLGGEGFLMQAAFTLACVTVYQTLVLAVYMRWREPGEITRVLRAWRVAGLVGLSGMLGSAGWFTAMTLQNAAYVKALGQIELVFNFAAARLIFRERSQGLEVAGILLTVTGIIILLLAWVSE